MTGYLRSFRITAEGGVIWWSPSDMAAAAAALVLC